LNTPAHVLLSAFALGRGRWRPHWVAITVGALLPDAPMFGFYAWQRIALRASDGRIWSEAYFDPAWQAFFDLFNSLPLIAIAALIAWRLGAAAWLAGLVSMALHCVADLALHREDAHGHLFPLSDWRFTSPVSYWDPEHYGLIFGGVELAFVAVGSIWLLRPGAATPEWVGAGWRGVAATTLALYGLVVLAVMLYWAGVIGPGV